MAFQMVYNNGTGVDHQESYWRVVQTNICQSEKHGMIQFYGYHNHQARLDGKAPIGQKTYSFGPETYNEWFGPTELSPEGRNPVAQAYDYALSVLDSGDQENPISFFNDAQNI